MDFGRKKSLVESHVLLGEALGLEIAADLQ